MGEKGSDRLKPANWIVVDQSANVHARIKHADYGTALAIARTAFPEFPDGELKVILHARASHKWRSAAKTAALLTPNRCAARGITWSRHLQWVSKLQHHFVGTGGER
jgi:hypothetical protein